jgi:hypothetical protein
MPVRFRSTVYLLPGEVSRVGGSDLARSRVARLRGSASTGWSVVVSGGRSQLRSRAGGTVRSLVGTSALLASMFSLVAVRAPHGP